jgi:hypothetical protein
MRERERERERERNIPLRLVTEREKYSFKISNRKSNNSFMSNLKGETVISIGLNKNYISFVS